MEQTDHDQKAWYMESDICVGIPVLNQEYGFGDIAEISEILSDFASLQNTDDKPALSNLN